MHVSPPILWNIAYVLITHSNINICKDVLCSSRVPCHRDCSPSWFLFTRARHAWTTTDKSSTHGFKYLIWFPRSVLLLTSHVMWYHSHVIANGEVWGANYRVTYYTTLTITAKNEWKGVWLLVDINDCGKNWTITLTQSAPGTSQEDDAYCKAIHHAFDYSY